MMHIINDILSLRTEAILLVMIDLLFSPSFLYRLQIEGDFHTTVFFLF